MHVATKKMLYVVVCVSRIVRAEDVSKEGAVRRSLIQLVRSIGVKNSPATSGRPQLFKLMKVQILILLSYLCFFIGSAFVSVFSYAP